MDSPSCRSAMALVSFHESFHVDSTRLDRASHEQEGDPSGAVFKFSFFKTWSPARIACWRSAHVLQLFQTGEGTGDETRSLAVPIQVVQGPNGISSPSSS